MSESRPTGPQISPARAAPNWVAGVWRAARSATARLVAALGKGDDEARARDREERVFHPREH